MTKKYRFKLLSFVVMFLMSFSSMTFAAGTQNITGQSAQEKAEIKQLAKEKLVDKLKAEEKFRSLKDLEQERQAKAHIDENGKVAAASPLDNDALRTVSNREDIYKDSDSVRVIIEMEGDSLAEYARKSNISINKIADKKVVQENIKAVQQKAKDAIKEQKLDVKLRHDYQTVLNGFSADVSKKDLEKVKKIPGVKNVTVANVYYRDMNTAVDLTNAAKVWEDLGYKGEGMVVAVIDTGIDYRHKDFQDIDKAKIAITADDVKQKILNGSTGKYFTPKVPVGWNWADGNDQVIDYGPGASMHGQHVAGIVGANGDIKGVAPQAQLLAEKVFSNNQLTGAFSDDLVAAINHAIEFDADVLNMSLGSSAGFVSPNDPEQRAISNAAAQGVICVVSAGNSAYTTYGWDLPHGQNPDTGVIGSPGLIGSSVQVAAANNILTLFEHNVNINGTTVVGYGRDLWVDKAEDGQKITRDLVTLGNKLGYPEDYDGIDVTGKVVLVKRGDLTFVDKIHNAYVHGAAGIIVYDHGLSTFFKDQGGAEIPFMHVTKADGEALEALLAKGPVSVEVSYKKHGIDASSGKPTDFSSWGPTPNLEFKPDIMAPGGMINSLANNDKYQYMSGTSMSAPHVAGGMALIKQSLEAENATPADLSEVEFAKIIAMNTAYPVKNQYGYEYQPRLQGAGMMQIDSAINTPVFITDQNKKAGISLKEMDSAPKSFTLTLTNMTDKEQTYDVSGTLATDYIFSDGYNSLISVYMDAENYDPNHVGTIASDIDQVKVPAKGKATVTVTVHVKKAPKNIFVEGYVYFTPVSADVPRLSVPYFGFYGDWNEPNIIDPLYSEEDSYYETTGLLTEIYYDLYYTDVMSPANEDGDFDYVLPIVSMLRNAKDFVVTVKDSKGRTVKTVDTSNYIRKPYDIDQGYAWYKLYSDWEWNGRDSGGRLVPDGMYSVELKTRIDYENAKWQTVNLPVLVDNTAPVMTISKVDDITVAGPIVDADGKIKLDWTAVENGSGLSEVALSVWEEDEEGYITGNYELYFLEDLSQASFQLKLPYKRNNLDLIGFDNALNSSWSKEIIIENAGFNSPEGAPEIELFSPEPLSILNSRDVYVEGRIDTPVYFDGVLKINGQPVEVEDNWFWTTLNFDSDGWKDIQVEAYYTDKFDPEDKATYENRTYHSYKVVVDTTEPKIDVDLSQVKVYKVNGELYFKINGTVSDETTIGNKLTANENTILNTSLDDVEKKWSKEFSCIVPAVNSGVTLSVSDLAGNNSILPIWYNTTLDGKPIIMAGGTFHEIELIEENNYNGPTVSIKDVSNINNKTIRNKYINIEAYASSVLGVKEVYINGREADVKDDHYILSVTLDEGANTIEVVAVDNLGFESRATATVIKDSVGPKLTISAYEEETKASSVTIEGTVSDPSGVKSLTVNGQPVTPGQDGKFSSTVNLAVGNNNIEIKATDNLDNIRVATLKVKRKDIENARLGYLALSTGSLTPVFAPDTTAYSADVANDVQTITVTPTVQDPEAKVRVNGKEVVNGTTSEPISLAFGKNTITVEVTAQDGKTVKTYTVNVNRAKSSDAALSALTVSAGTLTPDFDKAVIEYTVEVEYPVNNISVTPTVAEPNATIKVNGAAVESNTAYGPISLEVGANTVNVEVTAQDGETKKSYVITVSRAAARDNASLETLTLNEGEVEFAFKPEVTKYTLNVGSSVGSVTVNPTLQDCGAAVKVNGKLNENGTASEPVELKVGSNVISVEVTAQDGKTTKLYTITINRAKSSNANLSDIELSIGTLSPYFDGDTTDYVVDVEGLVSSITIIPTAADEFSVIKVGGKVVANGTESKPVTLKPGANSVTIEVTAQDGRTKKSYVVVINRAKPSNNAYLSDLAVSDGEFTKAFSYKTTSYTVNVPNEVAEIQVTPTAENENAAITVNKLVTVSGEASEPIALKVGSNKITVEVIAEDGKTKKRYTITVNRAKSTNANLESLVMNLGDSEEELVLDDVIYVDVDADVSSIKLTPAAEDSTASVKVNKSTVKPGKTSGSIKLKTGENTITITVTAGDGKTKQVYTLVVTRAQ